MNPTWRQKAEELDWEEKRRFLQPTRYRPLFDREFTRTLKHELTSAFHHQEGLKSRYLAAFDRWLHGSRLNRVLGLERFPHRDFIQGVTHSLDDLHVSQGNRLVCLEKEYSYHRRLRSDLPHKKPGELAAGDVLVLSAPFPWFGRAHPETPAILDRCASLGIPVHVDSAWFGCLRGFEFDYSHPAIRTVSFSLSKGLGLGSQRTGVRYARERHPGPVAVVNDFAMEVNSVMHCGIVFMEKFGSDYLQDRYGEAYDLVCERLGLEPTQALHMAIGELQPGEGRQPLGVRAFLRYLVDDTNEFH